LSSTDPSSVEDTLTSKDPSSVDDTLSSKDLSSVEDTLPSKDPSSVEDTLPSTDPSSVEDTLSSTDPSLVEATLSSQDSASTKKSPSVEDFSSIKKDSLAKNTDDIRELFNYITSAKGNSSVIGTSNVKDKIPEQADTTLGKEITPVKDNSAIKDTSAAKDTSVIKEALAIKEKLLLEGTTQDKATSTVNNTLKVVSEHSRVKDRTPAPSVVTEPVTLRSQRKNKFTGKESERLEAHSTEAAILEDVPAYRASSARNNPTSSVPSYRSGTNNSMENTSKKNVIRVGSGTNSTRKPQPENNQESQPATEFPAKV
jgi:hypothetical protein